MNYIIAAISIMTGLTVSILYYKKLHRRHAVFLNELSRMVPSMEKDEDPEDYLKRHVSYIKKNRSMIKLKLSSSKVFKNNEEIDFFLKNYIKIYETEIYKE